jgi:hypothetical protein
MRARGPSAELEQVRLRLVELDAAIASEQALATHLASRALQAAGYELTLAPLRRSRFERRRERPEATTPRQEHRGSKQPILHRTFGTVLRVS